MRAAHQRCTTEYGHHHNCQGDYRSHTVHDTKKSKTTGTFQVPPEQYEANLRKIVERIRRETKATVLFATTTPIIDDRAAQGRTKAEYELLEASTKVVAHNESVDDRIIGIMGGYIRWSRMVDDPNYCINLTERIAKRQLDPFAREVILMAHELR